MEVEIILTPDPIVIPPETLPTREIGAALEFRGIVREREGERALTGLHYEAYEPMARRRLEAHLAALGKEHACAAVLFIHRLGWVPVGEASLYIRVLSVHRGEALALLGVLVNRLKEDVPIWKVA